MEKLILKKFGTHKAFADAAGIGYRFWKRIRAGERSPSMRTIEGMATALKVPPGFILDEIKKINKSRNAGNAVAPI